MLNTQCFSLRQRILGTLAFLCVFLLGGFLDDHPVRINAPLHSAPLSETEVLKVKLCTDLHRDRFNADLNRFCQDIREY